ncbi:cupin [archaeon]|nr:cupin [archaeon]|tara:strand:+ start:2119 stop:2412 length:294 start_codon:yes stop_codon:yes gene_type:complete
MKNIKKLIEYPKEGILSKVVSKTDKIDTTLFCMAKGTDISDHTSTKTGFVYVIEGKGIFKLEGKDIEMAPGVFIPMKKNAVHSLKAEENTSFILVLC